MSDADTKATIDQVWREHHYLLDPHGAVAYTALQRYIDQHPSEKGFLLATAHPVKFPDVVEEILDIDRGNIIGKVTKMRRVWRLCGKWHSFPLESWAV